jgi:glycosidase
MRLLSNLLLRTFIPLIVVYTHIATVVLAQQSTKPMKTKKASPPSDKLVIYQVMTRLFGNLKTTNQLNGSMAENGVGKLSDFNDTALKAIKSFGYSHIWYTGVIEHATMEDFREVGIPLDNPSVIKGRAGSPYAIKDYYDVNPFLANDPRQEFEQLIERSHRNGLKVLIDFVPNHVAREYRSNAKPADAKDFGETDDKGTIFKPSNNFYYLPGKTLKVPNGYTPAVAPLTPYVENPAKATGNDVFSASPSLDDWFETVKLNYGVNYLDNRKAQFEPIPDTWLKMRDILSYWTKKGVDGFRCDMAEMVPVEFWAWCIPELKKVNPALIFIAEIYNPQQYRNYIFNGKFDYLYDKVGLYDALRRLMENRPEANVADITRVWQQESGDFAQHMLRFLENHDEQRIASRFFCDDPFRAVPAMMVSATLHTGPLMLYFGQELGVKAQGAEGFQGDDGRTTIFDFWGIPEYQAWVNGGKFDGGKLTETQRKLRTFYQDLVRLVNTSDAVKHGAFYDLQYANSQTTTHDHRKVYSYLRHSAKQKLLFVCNFDQQRSFNTTIKVPDHALETMGLSQTSAYSLKEIFYHASVKTQLSAQGEVSLQLAPNSVYVFEVQPLGVKK